MVPRGVIRGYGSGEAERRISTDHARASSTQSGSHTAARVSWPVVSCTDTDFNPMETISTAVVPPASSVLYIPSLPCHVSFTYLLLLLIFICLYYILFAGCRIQGTKSSPQTLGLQVLATGPPVKSPLLFFITFPLSQSLDQEDSPGKMASHSSICA